jgi:hypothetical protein
MGSWKKMLVGEKMPDKNDPQYKERYEKEVASGRKFARWAKLDKLVAKIQGFACRKPMTFIAITFSILVFCCGLNIYRIVKVCSGSKTEQVTTATQRQEQLLKQYRGTKTIKSIDNDSERSEEN